jgi:hypothetical protein
MSEIRPTPFVRASRALHWLIPVCQRPAEQEQADGDAWSHDLYEGNSTSARKGRPSPFEAPRTSCKLQINNLHYEVSERELSVRPNCPAQLEV